MSMGPPRGSADPLPRMQEAGYSADRRILDAADHGVPQRRRRTIILAAKAPLAFGWPAPAAGRPPCFRAFALGDEEARASTVGAYNLFMTPEKAAYYLKRKRERPGYTRFVDPDAVCSTLRAGYLKSRGAEALVARDAAGELTATPGEDCCSIRMLALAEVMTIQSFPPGYKWKGPAGAVYQQIGNAVPPKLAEALGRSIVSKMA